MKKSMLTKNYMRVFLTIFIPIFLVFFFFSFLFFSNQTKSETEHIFMLQNIENELIKKDIVYDLNHAISDLTVIKNSSEISAFIAVQNKYTSNEILRIFKNMGISSPTYKSISLLDISGGEIEKVEFNDAIPLISEKNNLRQMDLSAQFQIASEPKNNVIYLSQYFSNGDGGQKNPNLSIMVPIASEKSKHAGYLKIEYLLENTFDKIEAKNQGGIRTQLLNSDGQLIYPSDETNENFSENASINIVELKNSPYLDKNYVAANRIYSIHKLDFNTPGLFSQKIMGDPIFLVTSYDKNRFGFFQNDKFRNYFIIDFVFLIILIFSSIFYSWFIINKAKSYQKMKLSDELLKNINEATFALDEEFHFLFINETFTKLLGYKYLENINTSISIESKDFILTKRIIEEVDFSSYWEGEVKLKDLDNNQKPFFLKLSKIEDSNTNIRYIGILKDISREKALKDSLFKIKNYDSATSLPRYHLFTRLMSELLSPGRNYFLVSFKILNYDELVAINKLDEVDEALSELLSNIRAILANNESVLGKYLSNEFFILIENLDNSFYLIDEIKNLFIQNENNLLLNSVFGVSSYPEDAKDSLDLIKKSILARNYAEKTNNSLEFFNSQIESGYTRRIFISEVLKDAFEKDKFFLNFQPIMDSEKNEVYAVEVLLRLPEYKGENISPGEFINVAEDSGLMNEIGNIVLEKACSALDHIHSELKIKVVFSINISPVQFLGNNFVLNLDLLLKKYSIPKNSLILEITEDIFLDNSEKVNDLISKIKSLGIKIALDDFGSGYSSLYYLNNENIDILKIDKQFISDYPNKPADILKTIFGLGNSLNIETIAEGVETKEQLELLDNLGLNKIQGFYFSKPLNMEDLINYLKKH